MRLSDEQVACWERDGFLGIDRLIDEDTLATLRTAYDGIISGDVEARFDRMLGGITRQVMMPSTSHVAFKKNHARDNAAAVANQLLGADTAMEFDMLIYKPPGHPHPTPWHQDMSYVGTPFAPAGIEIRLETIQFWIPLDDVDVENGCMHFLPGHQRKPLLEHRIASGEPTDPGRLLEIVDAEKQVDLDAVVAVPLPAGGATLHGYGTPHYTPPNTSADRPRRAYIFSLGIRENVERRRRDARGEPRVVG